ncbi:MAG: hypothetical protein LBQ82_01725 [Treponema sp.]|jgi:hypothetical protein|nr:hypothetical protein [Treponema sp.]
MKVKLVLLMFFAAVPLIFSITLEELVDPAHAAQLRSGESVTATQLKNPVLRLLPNSEELRQFTADINAALAPTLAVETLYLYKKNSDGSSDNWTEEQRTSLFNHLLSMSTLTGIEYYSASRQTMRTFYESSVVIDGPSTKKPLPDPVFSQPPAKYTLFARQKDLTFGDNIYRYDFISSQDALIFSQENLTAMVAGIIPAVGKNKLRSVLAVIDCGDSLLIYAVSMAKAVSVPGMGDRIGNSFGNRAEAVLKWFIGKADGVFVEN